jgi:formylglycine-generating enzyme required for sulfatase activity
MLSSRARGSAERAEDGADNRYAEYVAPLMVEIEPRPFAMGTSAEETAHFCGETPEHVVELSPFSITAFPVTNDLLARVGDERAGVGRRVLRMPVVGVTWFDATRFARWLGCELPTEAQWEYACGAGAASQWCCEDERDLPAHAWYSDNAGGRLHDVGTREPNAFGLFDLHGNVWEWCADLYEGDFYQRSPRRDPRNGASRGGPRACRGGSVHGLAEMCRTRYRQPEPPEFSAQDLGFRLVRHTSARGGRA